MEAIDLNLPLCHLDNNPPAYRLPAFRSSKLRTENAQKKKSDALSEQMRVGGKICGKIACNVAPIQRHPTKPLFAEIGQPRRTLQQVVRPEPCQAAKSRLQAA